MGGFLSYKNEYEKYVILSNGRNSWSVNTKTNIFYRKMGVGEIKDSYQDEISELNEVVDKQKKELKKQKKELKKLKKELELQIEKEEGQNIFEKSNSLTNFYVIINFGVSLDHTKAYPDGTLNNLEGDHCLNGLWALREKCINEYGKCTMTEITWGGFNNTNGTLIPEETMNLEIDIVSKEPTLSEYDMNRLKELTLWIKNHFRQKNVIMRIQEVKYFNI